MTACVTLTLTTTAYTITRTFTDARCPDCNRKLMAIPGRMTVQPRIIKNDADRSGRGRVVKCNRCSSLVEIIEHAG